jgi:fructose-specific phosphotransferase system IIC component
VAIAVPAEVPVLPAHSPLSVMFAGFWIALLAAIVAGYLAELADSSFRTPSEVEELLNVTVLAAVPRQVA